jgi:hypothetical protein
MPNRWPISSGNWSNSAIWSGSLIPTASDDVFANNFTVNVDQNIEVTSLRNTSGTGITAGGSFNFNTGNISSSISSNTPFIASATNLIGVTANTGSVLISLLSSNPSISAPVSPSQVINHVGNCDLQLSLPAGSSISFTALSNTTFINKSSPGTLTLDFPNGSVNMFGGSITNAQFISSSNGDTTIVSSFLSRPLPTTATGLLSLILQTSGNLTVNSTIGNGDTNRTIINFSGNTLIITGSCGGASGTTPSIQASGLVHIISGSLSAFSAASIQSTTANQIIVIGPILAGTSPAVISTSTSATNIFTGPFTNNGSVMAVQCARMFLTGSSTSWEFTTDAATTETLYTIDQIPTYPSSSDVRLGTTYASGSFTGTLAMPTAPSVQYGVPVDNTTGSALLTTASLASAIWDTSRTQLTGSGTIGERLKDVATPTTTGTQIASYLL